MPGRVRKRSVPIVRRPRECLLPPAIPAIEMLAPRSRGGPGSVSPRPRRFNHALNPIPPPSKGELNINAMDAMGRTAIEIAVDNENVEIVQLLLEQPKIRVGNALLCAIREGVYRLVELLINHDSITKEMLGDGWTQYLDPAEAASAEYSSDISPIILAAHLNQYEILTMLEKTGATIERPHRYSCMCESCDRERLNDSLHYSLKRINTFKALASPAWISLTSNDPVRTAFELSWDLEQLSRIEHEFKDIYAELSEQCKQYACDLLSQCRSSEEAVLNKEESEQDVNIDVWTARLSLSRLKLAIKYGQKSFVSHPHCQQLLTSIWYEGFPGRQQRGSVLNIFICLLLIIMWPLLSIIYIIFPKSRLGRIVRSPFMKFLYYSISFSCFLVLLTVATFEDYRFHKGESYSDPMPRSADRGPPPTLIETLIVFFVVGMMWSEMKQLWDEGFTTYRKQWWNWLDFAMICLYLCTISLRASAYFVFSYQVPDSTRFHVRTHWFSSEPMLVAEALFAVGNVFSFARIIYLFQTHPGLGPLQISLGNMIFDVAKFTLIFILIISSFSIGLAQLYWYYDPTRPVCIDGICHQESNVFSSIADSYQTLLWSLFSITKVEDTDVTEPHYVTQFVGRALFITYHMVSIIVLLNMLIAMMSHSFQTINDHADLEWKFHRTKLWMTHFDEGSSLSPPFNIIITPKAIVYTLNKTWNTIRWIFGKYEYAKGRTRATIRRPGYSRKQHMMQKEGVCQSDEESQNKPLTYAHIIQRLVTRYNHQTKKGQKMDGVNEDDLLEIKQDISSLRYELRDDRRKEIVRSASHIDAVKRDIMRTMSSTTRAFSAGSSLRRIRRHRPSVAEESDDDDISAMVPYTPAISVKSEDDYIELPATTRLPSPPLDSASSTATVASRTCALPAPLSPGVHSTQNMAFRSSAPSSASPRHSALRKTDTQFSFKLASSPKMNRRHDPPPGALEAILKLREDLNTRLDALAESINPRSTKVGFVDDVNDGE
ncbi:hypothetical protein PFISCL1PPCAC_9395, partial [Pristionchus fissidentatus]